MTRLRMCAMFVASLILAASAALGAAPLYGPAGSNGGMAQWLAQSTGAIGSGSVDNGGFETGILDVWTVADEVDGSGTWFINHGGSSPLSALPIPAPAEGSFNTTSDQTGPGSHLLYQDIALSRSSVQRLSFIYSVDNRGADYVSPPSLDALGGFANQQFRIDILDPSAVEESVAAGDILMALFATRPGDPAQIPPTLLQADISQFAGRTIRLRFAQVDNQNFLQAGVDAVQITTGQPAPALSHFLLAVVAGLLVWAVSVGRGRRAVSTTACIR